MGSKGVSNWKRPYTSIYNDNYRYGTGLYNDTLTDIEKRYSDSLSKTQLRSDRPDLGFSTFAGSGLTSSPTPGAAAGDSRISRQTSRTSEGRDLARSLSSTFESRVNTAMHGIDEDVQDVINSRAEKRKQRAAAMMASMEEDLPVSRRPKSLYDDAAFFSLPKAREALEDDFDFDKVKIKKRVNNPGNGPSSSGWREKSRLLQDQVESLETNMSSVGNKLQSELSSLKSKYHSEISDLNHSVELTSQQASDLQKLCKRQANQLLELQSAYDDSQHNIQDALQEVSMWQNKCKGLKKEMDRLREEVEMAVTKSSGS